MSTSISEVWRGVGDDPFLLTSSGNGSLKPVLLSASDHRSSKDRSRVRKRLKPGELHKKGYDKG